MQCVLGIDLSCQPCELTLSHVDGVRVELVRRITARLPLFADKDLLNSEKVLEFIRPKGAGAEAVGPQGSEAGAAVELGDSNGDVVLETVASLKEAVSSFDQEWTASTVILPSNEFLALNLDLPFGDAKNLDRIVDLEVQDVVPFDLDSYFVQYSSLGDGDGVPQAGIPQTAGKQHDVHIGILPRVVVRNILEVCRSAGVEPNVLTVPSSALGAAFHLAKGFIEGNAAVVYNRGDEYSVSVFINGDVRVERSLYASQIVSALPPENRQENLQHVFTALKLIMAAAERRYNARIEKVYLLGRDVKGSNTSQLFGRPLEGLPFKDLVQSQNGALGLAPLGAVFAQDESPAIPLSNFRSREFSFTPKLSEFIRALVGTRRAVLRALAGIVLAALVVYTSRQYLLSSSEKALVSRIQKVIPGFTAERGKILEGLAKAEGKLGQELSAFGSRAKFSPADALLEVIKVVPSDGSISITSLRVTGDKVLLQGTASEVAAVERFSKALGSRAEIFSKVDYKNAKTTTGFTFTVDIMLAQ